MATVEGWDNDGLMMLDRHRAERTCTERYSGPDSTEPCKPQDQRGQWHEDPRVWREAIRIQDPRGEEAELEHARH